jgi:monoamine oxidase
MLFSIRLCARHRGLLALPSGRIFFAGEHTGTKWQGAVESGLRAANEILASMDSSR